MDWFDSFLFYKYYATVQAVGWVFIAFQLLIIKNQFSTLIMFLTILFFAGASIVYMLIRFFQ